MLPLFFFNYNFFPIQISSGSIWENLGDPNPCLDTTEIKQKRIKKRKRISQLDEILPFYHDWLKSFNKEKGSIIRVA